MSELYKTIYEKCDIILQAERQWMKLNASSSSLSSITKNQLKFILSENQIPFAKWYNQQIVPELQAAQRAVGKSLTEANRYRQFGEIYKSFEYFRVKAIESFNKVKNCLMSSIQLIFIT